jgi:hypothetical protein
VPGFPEEASARGAAEAARANAQYARDFYGPLLPLVAELRARGLSLRAIARELESRGIQTRQEWPRWHARQVARVLARAEGAGRVEAAPGRPVAPPRG